MRTHARIGTMKTKLIGLGITALLLTSACGGVASPAPSGEQQEQDNGGAQVEIVDFAYSPETLDVAVGETIVWKNEDDIAHTVTSGKPKKQGVPGVSPNRDAQPDGVFDSGTMELDDTFEFTPDEAGAFTYFCAIHAGMSARIVVR